jgi:hypothetical protein
LPAATPERKVSKQTFRGLRRRCTVKRCLRPKGFRGCRSYCLRMRAFHGCRGWCAQHQLFLKWGSGRNLALPIIDL